LKVEVGLKINTNLFDNAMPCIKALQKTENSEFCTFAKIILIQLPKYGNFLKIISSYVIAKFWQNLTKALTKLS
jgi:hypothetical protein